MVSQIWRSVPRVIPRGGDPWRASCRTCAALGRNVRLRVSTNALKSVDHNGGLDAYLLKARADVLSPRALDLKRAIEKKVGKPAPLAKAS